MINSIDRWLPLARIYEKVLAVDFFGLESQHKGLVKPILQKILDKLQPDVVIFVSHHYFWPIARQAFKCLEWSAQKHLPKSSSNDRSHIYQTISGLGSQIF